MVRRVYIYGFNKLHEIVDVKFLQEDAISIKNMMWITEQMIANTEAHQIYAIDNRWGLRRDFMDSIKSTDFVKHIEFEDLVPAAQFLWLSRV